MSSSEPSFYVVISLGRNIQGSKLTASRCFDSWVRDKSGIGEGRWDGMRLCQCGFCEPSLIWSLPCQEVPCSICKSPGHAIKNLYRLTKCRWWWWRCLIYRLRFNDSRNLPFGCLVHPIILMEVVGRGSPAWLRQFVKLHLLLPKTLRAILYRFSDCAHHTARFVIFPKLALCRIFYIIIFVIPILLNVGTCNIAQTISDGVLHLLRCCFRLGGCQSRLFSISHIILHLLNCCLRIFNSLSCQSGLSFHIILDPFLLLFVT